MKKTVTTSKTISSEEFDKLADAGSDKIDQYLDWENATRPGLNLFGLISTCPPIFWKNLTGKPRSAG